MRKFPVGVVLLLVFCLVPSAFPQNQPKPHVDVPIIPAKAEDVGSIEAIVKVSYDTISGGTGVPRQWAR